MYIGFDIDVLGVYAHWLFTPLLQISIYTGYAIVVFVVDMHWCYTVVHVNTQCHFNAHAHCFLTYILRYLCRCFPRTLVWSLVLPTMCMQIDFFLFYRRLILLYVCLPSRVCRMVQARTGYWCLCVCRTQA